MSNNPKLATEQQVKDVSDTFTEIINHQGKQIKALESGVIDAIEPSSPAPTKRGEYKVTKPGIYLNFKDGNGQPISVTQEDYSLGNVSIIFNGTDNRKLVVPITFEGEVKEGDTRGVSGMTVNEQFTKFSEKKIGKNKANNKYIYPGYVQGSNGNVINTSASSLYRYIIVNNLEELGLYVISGIDKDNSTLPCVFIDKDNNKLKPLDENGNEYPSFRISSSGIFRVPRSAVSMIKTISWTGGDIYNNTIQIENGSEVTKYQVYSETIIINNESLPDIIKNNDILIIGGSLYNNKKVITDSIINSSSGEINFNKNSIVSDIMNIPYGTSYIKIEGRTSDSNGVRFLGKNGEIIKPIDNEGNTYQYFSSGPKNGIYRVPHGAVSCQVNIKFTKGSSDNIVILINGKEKTVIKEEYLLLGDTIQINKSVDTIQINRKGFSDELSIRHNDQQISNSSINFNHLKYRDKIIKYSGDDISPLRLFDSGIGGNHGWEFYFKIISETPHKKKISDIGAVYKEKYSQKEYVLVAIPTDTEVHFIPLTEYSKSPLYSEMIYVRNGTNTESIIFDKSEQVINPYNFTFKHPNIIKYDNQDISNIDGNFEGKELSILESYNVFDLLSVASKFIENRPLEGYLSVPNFNNVGADVLFTINNRYLFKELQLIVTSDVYFQKEPDFSYYSGLQLNSFESNNKILIPYTKPIKDGDELKDFSSIVNFTKPKNQIHFTKEFWKYSDLVPNRVLLSNSEGIFMSIGYLDRGEVNDAIFIHTNSKIYPRAFDYTIPRKIKSGEVISCTVYRNLELPKTSKKYHLDVFELNNNLIIKIDVLEAYEGIIEISGYSNHIGKKVIKYQGDGKKQLESFMGFIPVNSSKTESFEYIF
ncbi:hypothetical protein [Myroides marinus]|uniref:hypothetical protein n=1 Tax=Myroides marinus TaxID=703342 RepID=UPI0025789BAB|nr:hypothetical protein [Myroides marinus]MDM1378160.1 hypothetical protein [Myroides marinus]MDM1385454.1 hypothetical protein [Myroides marinus]MDM1392667.1 hypothetical protein [Myroides marinus]